MVEPYSMRRRWVVELSDECCYTLERVADTPATADVLAELFARLETRAHFGTPVEDTDLRVIRSDDAIIDGELVPAIRLVYTTDADGLPPDTVLVMDIAYVGSREAISIDLTMTHTLPSQQH